MRTRDENGRTRPYPIVEICPAPRGRATGWLVDCEHHGKMPVLAPSRDAAVIAAGRHLEHEHRRSGRIVFVEVPDRRKRKKKKHGKRSAA